MRKIFEIDVRQGSLKDRVSGTIPTISNIAMPQTEHGRSCYFGGIAGDFLNYPLAFSPTSGSIWFSFRTETPGKIFCSQTNLLSDTSYLSFGIAANNKIFLSFNGGGGVNNVIGTKVITDNQWHLAVLSSSGSTYSFFIDNAADNVTLGTNNGNWFGDVPGRNAFIVGKYLGLTGSGSGFFNGGCLEIGISSDELSASERTAVYDKFVKSKPITKPIVVKKDTNIARLEGTQTYALASVANYRSSDSAGSIEADFRISTSGTYTIFSSADEGSITRYMQLMTISGKINVAQSNNDTLDLVRGQTIVSDGKWHHVRLVSNGIAYTIQVDGATESLTIAGGANTGDWFAETTSRDNITIGVAKRSAPFTAIQHWPGELSNVIVRDATGTIVNHWKLDESGGNIAYDSVGSTHLTWTGSGWNGVSGKNMVVSVDGTNWNADGGTTNASFGNLEKGSGAFRCLQDATGKYIECTTNGTLTLKGIDLSIFTGNGYLKKVLGDLSGDAGGTVDASSAFAFSGNVLTITMTAGQKLRGFTITASA